jgi:dipeptidyl-peptidase-4
MKTLPIILSLLVSGCGWLATARAASPGQRAETPRIYRDKVDPHWLESADKTNSRFWYRVELPGNQQEFILVDAEKGARAPAFDHDRVAEALSKLLGKPVDAKALPITSLSFSPDGAKVTLLGREGSWELDLQSYAITSTQKSAGEENRLRPRRLPEPSGDSDTESGIRFINKRHEEVDIYWVDNDGKRQFYASIPPGEEREMHTYASHSWLVTAKNGDPIAAFKAEEKAGVAIIEDPMRFEERPDRPRRRSAPPAEEAKNTRSPDGKWEVLVRGDNLFLRDIKTGTAQQVTYDAQPDSSYARNAEEQRSIGMRYDAADPKEPVPEVYWSPDSRHFVAMRYTRGSQRRVTLVESSPEEQLQPKVMSIPYLKPGDDVPYAKPHLFDAQAKKEIPVSDELFANPWSIGDVRWNRDSSEFTFLFNQRGHQALRILGVKANSGAVRAIVEETSKTFICYSSKFFVEHLDDTGEIIWMSERDGWNHLYLYDAKTGQVKNQITKGEWVVRGVDLVDREKRQICFRAGGMNPDENPYFVHYYRINFDGSGLTALTSGNGTHSVQYSPDQRFLIDTWSRVDQPPVSELHRVADGKLLCRLEEADISELTASGWRAPEPFIAKGRDGRTDIYGIIRRPSDFDAAKKYPVIEDIYAGPGDSYVPMGFSAYHGSSDLLNKGFIIVQIDGMGTSNRSKAFQDVAYKNLADAGLPDRMLWIKAAAATRPWMDLNRVGIFGTSAGGQSALRALLDHGDFYKAAVADSGCHDNRMDKIWWNEQWMGWPVDESYARNSNVVAAHKLTGKLLLMVGEMDTNVDPASTFQVVNALIKAGKPFELLDMPGAGHGVLGTNYGRQRLIDFFTRAFLPAGSEK